MTYEREMAEKNKIMECWAGSHLYGFNRPDSDEDFRGVFIPDKEYIYGLTKKIEQLEQKEPDRVLYSLHKFIQLALKNNPNIIELLYVPDNKMIFCHPIWDVIRENANLILSKKCKHSFSGYAHDQLQRIKGHKKWIDDPLEVKPVKEDYINTMVLEVGKKAQFIQSGWDEIELISVMEGGVGWVGSMEEGKGGYAEFYNDSARIQYFRKDEYKAAITKWKEYHKWKKERNPKRAALEAIYHYDVKHATHLIRLYTMSVEILETGKVTVDRSAAGDVQLYIDILNGKYKYEELIEMAEDLENKCDKLYETSDLRHSPDVDKINDLLIDILDEYWSKNNEH